MMDDINLTPEISDEELERQNETYEEMMRAFEARTKPQSETRDESSAAEPHEYTDEERKAYGERKREERSELFNLMDSSTAEAAQSRDGMAEFLNVAANFPNMGTGNLMLIYAQRPEATQLRTYDDWQRSGNAVKKGAAAIRLFSEGREYEAPDASVRQSFSEVKSYFDAADTVKHPTPSKPTVDHAAILKSLLYSCPQAIKPDADVGIDAFYDEEDNIIRVLPGQELPKMVRGIIRESSIASLMQTYDDRLLADFPACAAAYIYCKRNKIGVSDIELPIERLEGLSPKDIRSIITEARRSAASIERQIARGQKRVENAKNTSGEGHEPPQRNQHDRHER